MWGNVLQTGGNALQAEGQGGALRKIGEDFQSIGNFAVITWMVINLNKQTAQKIFITGYWIQALGGLINVGHGIELNPFLGHSENINGNLLQSTGNSLQAIGGVYELEKNGNTDNLTQISSRLIGHLSGSILILMDLPVARLMPEKKVSTNQLNKSIVLQRDF
ncbi:DUF6944 family repetitive protein [Peribacillus butanolivorans]|uniref:DUF6944 family repetitive protein n=1 Tax=Peribacillus butanolivorans TaxID=421767 RepID=UPI0035D945F9